MAAPLAARLRQFSKTKSFVLVVVIASTIAISSIFALVKGVEGAPPFLRSSWRLQSTALVTFPFAYHEYEKNPRAINAYRTGSALKYLVLTAVGYSAYNMFFSLGLTLACVMHVVIFSQSSPLLIVIYDIARGKRVSRRQISGCILAFFGAAVSSAEEAHDAGAHAPSTAYGIAFSLFAAAGYAFYVSNASRVREHVSLFLYLSPMCAVAAVISGTASLVAEGTLLSADPSAGLFGWTDASRFNSVLLIAIIPGIFGLSGVSYGFKFLSALEATVIANLEPLFGSALGIMLGEPLPGPTVLLGGVMLLAGTFAVVDPSSDPHAGGGSPPSSAGAAAAAAKARTADRDMESPPAPGDGAGASLAAAAPAPVFSMDQSSTAIHRTDASDKR